MILGGAYGTYIQSRLNEKTVVVGHDFRKYSRDLCRSFVVGLLSTGVRVVDVGLCLTPMLHFAQYHFKVTSGAMLTASHNENGWAWNQAGQGLVLYVGTAGHTGLQVSHDERRPGAALIFEIEFLKIAGATP